MLRKRLQLGLLHLAVAMTLVPINSTLNRVMIHEFAISATLVAGLASLPYLFSPIQVAIGSFADRHPIAGRRRSPYILFGLVLCVLGVVVSPLVAYMLVENFWMGLLFGVLAFGLWGMGYNFSAVSYLSLASEISGEKEHGRTIAVMFVMMIIGIIVTALTLSRLVENYTPETLTRAFWIVGLSALFLGLLGLIKLEERSLPSERQKKHNYTWNEMSRAIWGNRQARLFFWYLIILLTALLGQDILLEPFAAAAFGMPIQETTRITSIWGGCMLITLIVAGILEGKVQKKTVAQWGGWMALAGFGVIVLSGVVASVAVFYTGVVLLGAGTGLATVSNLSLMLDMTTRENVGLFIGAWGMANAGSRLFGSVLGGGVRDLVTWISSNIETGYLVVFGIETFMLLVSLIMLERIDVSKFRKNAEQLSLVERAAIANDV
jgi:MFS transporter, BCD family, chlorophyll transporter